MTDYNTKAVNAYVDAYQRRDNNSDTARRVDSETRQQMNNLLQRLCSVRSFLLSVACNKLSYLGERSEPRENAQASREAARGRPRQSRLLSRASRACTFHDIPQMESLLAGYVVKKASLVICNGLFLFSHRTSQVEPRPLLLDTVFKSSTLPWKKRQQTASWSTWSFSWSLFPATIIDFQNSTSSDFYMARDLSWLHISLGCFALLCSLTNSWHSIPR